MPESAIPDGMKVVSKEEFFRALYADPRDIMPSTSNPYLTDWAVVRTREIWGRTLPGWKNPREKNVYMLKKDGLHA